MTPDDSFSLKLFEQSGYAYSRGANSCRYRLMGQGEVKK